MLNQIQGFRLSPPQKRLWFLHENSTAYNTVCAIDCDGVLHVKALHAALQQLVNQHEILRTSYQRKPGIAVPIQVIAEAREVSLNVMHLDIEPVQEQQTLVAQYIAHEQRKSFEESLVFTASLLMLAPQKPVLLISLPALSADAETMKSIIKDLSKNYNFFTQEENIPVDDEAVQYLQFSEWQNELLESDEADTGKKFWQQRMKQLAFPHIPGESTAQADGDFHFAVEEQRQILPSELSDALQQASQKLEISETTLIFATWQLLLWRLSDQRQLSTGAVFNGRTYEELRTVLGLFTTTLPITTKFAGNTRFTDFLKQIEHSMEEATRKQEYFLSEEVLNEHNRLLFPISFEYIEFPASYAAGNITFSISHMYTCAEPFNVKLLYISRGQQKELVLQYNPRCFAVDTIQRLSGYYQTLLNNVLNTPDAQLSQFAILSTDEQKWLLVDLNNTAANFPRQACFHTLFEEQVALTPEQSALEFDGLTITYAELNRRANQLAHFLRKQRIGPEALVGLYMQRSIEMVVAILGILKAGGAYVPLEPGLPAERLRFQLEDTQMPIILTQRRLAETLTTPSCVQSISLDALAETLVLEPATNPENLTVPTNLAYIIYTSGSTGTPKGVMVQHRSLVNYLSWARKEYNIIEGTGSPVHSPLGFDLTITSLLLPLIAGQTALLLAENLGVSALGTTLQQRDLSLIKLTPVHLRLLNSWIESRHAIGKTHVFVLGGEALTSEVVAFWQQNAPETRIINEYGPTESVVGCCIYEVPTTTALTGDLPIGHPITNTQIYILDTYFHPVPVEATGELYIGGAGLARGYLSRPDLTAERFLPNPFSNEPGARLYRTGDLASYQTDGNIRFHGRNDQQIKIRGFRVELGEIEAVLKQHPAVRECLVRPYKEASGTYSLAAYLVTADLQKEFPENEVRKLGQDKLPEYMVPTIFIPVPSFPFTRNGKVDIGALPDPTSYQRYPKVAYTAPRSGLEQDLTTIWQEILHLEKIGIQDNFFDLGGNSFLLIEATSKIQKSIDAEITLLAMFEHPTIIAIADYIKQKKQPEAPDTLLKIQERARKQRDAMARTIERKGKTL